MNTLNLFIVILTYFWATASFGRWAKPEEAQASLEYRRISYQIAKDGTYVFDCEELIKILNEQGRSDSATRQYSYNSRADKFELLKAESIIDGQSYPVPDNFIEDKPKASNISGFDQQNQVTLAFPKAEVGAKLYVKYRIKVFEAAIPNTFSAFWFFGNSILSQQTTISFLSEIPLFLKVNDPASELEVKKSLDHGQNEIQVKQKRPVFYKVVDEDKRAFLKLEYKPYIMVSSDKDYAPIAERLSKEYDNKISKDIGPLLSKMTNNIDKSKDFIDQANVVTSTIADSFRYMGDWRPVHGGFVPRDLEEIINSKFGDCKDLSLLTAYILRQLGFEANLAVIQRGRWPTELYPLGSGSSFNHAVVFVTHKSKNYLIDPTNSQSFAQGIPEDLLNRQLLILDTKNPRLSDTPIDNVEHSKSDEEFIYRFDASGDAVLDYKGVFSGRIAFPFIGIERYASAATINHNFSEYLSDHKFVKWSHIDKYDLTSRIVKDVKFVAKLGIKNLAVNSSAGFAYFLDKFGLSSIDPKTHVSDIFLGSPRISNRTEIITNAKTVGKLPKEPCILDTPWFYAMRKITVDGRRLVINDIYRGKKNAISNKELKGPQYEGFHKLMLQCYNDYALNFKLLK